MSTRRLRGRQAGPARGGAGKRTVRLARLLAALLALLSWAASGAADPAGPGGAAAEVAVARRQIATQLAPGPSTTSATSSTRSTSSSLSRTATRSTSSSTAATTSRSFRTRTRFPTRTRTTSTTTAATTSTTSETHTTTTTVGEEATGTLPAEATETLPAEATQTLPAEEATSEPAPEPSPEPAPEEPTSEATTDATLLPTPTSPAVDPTVPSATPDIPAEFADVATLCDAVFGPSPLDMPCADACGFFYIAESAAAQCGGRCATVYGDGSITDGCTGFVGRVVVPLGVRPDGFDAGPETEQPEDGAGTTTTSEAPAVTELPSGPPEPSPSVDAAPTVAEEEPTGAVETTSRSTRRTLSLGRPTSTTTAPNRLTQVAPTGTASRSRPGALDGVPGGLVDQIGSSARREAGAGGMVWALAAAAIAAAFM